MCQSKNEQRMNERGPKANSRDAGMWRDVGTGIQHFLEKNINPIRIIGRGKTMLKAYVIKLVPTPHQNFGHSGDQITVMNTARYMAISCIIMQPAYFCSTYLHLINWICNSFGKSWLIAIGTIFHLRVKLGQFIFEFMQKTLFSEMIDFLWIFDLWVVMSSFDRKWAGRP